MKYTFEEKLNIVTLIKSGYPLNRLCNERHLDHKMVEIWRDRYELYGDAGLRSGTKAYGCPAKVKEEIVREHLEKSVSLSSLSIIYDVSCSAIKVWMGKVRQSGYGALYRQKKRGRPPKDPMARPKKREPQTELEKLQAENLRLRAENALLKKVKALVEEQQARARLNGQKPSTN